MVGLWEKMISLFSWESNFFSLLKKGGSTYARPLRSQASWTLCMRGHGSVVRRHEDPVHLGTQLLASEQCKNGCQSPSPTRAWNVRAFQRWQDAAVALMRVHEMELNAW